MYRCTCMKIRGSSQVSCSIALYTAALKDCLTEPPVSLAQQAPVIRSAPPQHWGIGSSASYSWLFM